MSTDSPRERLAWQGAALALGEKLADVGPNGYYSMSPAEWMTWCSARIIELKSAQSEIGAQPNAAAQDEKKSD